MWYCIIFMWQLKKQSWQGLLPIGSSMPVILLETAIKTCLRMSELPIYRQIPHKTSPINQLIWTGQSITTVTNSRQIDSPKTITLSHSSHSQAICLETGLWYRARQLAFSIHLMSESSFQVGFYRTFVSLFSEPSSDTTPDVTVRGTGDAGEFIHSVITDYDY